MCFALPADNRENKRESRIPAPLRILFGGLVFVAILCVSMVVGRLARSQ
jgi:hypothetical protein